MPRTELQQLTDHAKTLAQKASGCIRSVYESNDFQARKKEDNTPITRADRASHEVISAGLDETPYPVLSEEGVHPDYAERCDWERFWLVDPLDGTKSFVQRTGHFVVNIALIEGDKPILGVVAQPVTGETFWATKAGGAHKRTKEGTRPVSCRAAADRTVVVTSQAHFNERTKTYLAGWKNIKTVRLGSAEKFLHLADGRADVYPRFGPTMEWDTAAPQIIVEEAGGSVRNVETGQPLSYNKRSLKNPFFVARGC